MDALLLHGLGGGPADMDLRGRDCCPVADGADSVGVQGCIRPASLSAPSASLGAACFFAGA